MPALGHRMFRHVVQDTKEWNGPVDISRVYDAMACASHSWRWHPPPLSGRHAGDDRAPRGIRSPYLWYRCNRHAQVGRCRTILRNPCCARRYSISSPIAYRGLPWRRGKNLDLVGSALVTWRDVPGHLRRARPDSASTAACRRAAVTTARWQGMRLRQIGHTEELA